MKKILREVFYWDGDDKVDISLTLENDLHVIRMFRTDKTKKPRLAFDGMFHSYHSAAEEYDRMTKRFRSLQDKEPLPV